VERTWGDLESKGSNLYSSPQIIRVRFWVYNQPPVLENCSSDHSCQQHLQAQTCSCSGARNMDPPHKSMPSTHHIYTLSLSFCQGKTTTTTYTCLWSQSWRALTVFCHNGQQNVFFWGLSSFLFLKLPSIFVSKHSSPLSLIQNRPSGVCRNDQFGADQRERSGEERREEKRRG
jgi:hypothetical protein